MIPKEDLVLTMNSLIEICRDGNQGFKDAGDDVKDKKLRDLLHYYSEQRMNFSLELGQLVESLGGDINVTGSILGSLHRRWMDIRFGFIGSSTKGIIKECLRGEKIAIKKYENALRRDLPETVRNKLEYHYVEIIKVSENLLRISGVYGFDVALD